MAEQTYTATPITIGLPSDASIEYMANRWQVTKQAVAEKLLPKKNTRNGLSGILSMINDFQSPSNGAFSLLVTSLRQSFQRRKRTCKGRKDWFYARQID